VLGARLITAIKTPYLPSGKIDIAAYDAHVERQIAGGVQGLVVGGTTGEGQLMSWDEHIMLIAHTVNRFGDQLAILGNTGSNNTAEALKATEQGFNVGMHAALQINPYYGKTSERGLLEHFGATLDLGPGIVYNVVGRTNQDIRPHVVEELARHENFLGMKECEGNERIAGYSAQGIACWSGNDDEAHDARHQAGATGVISVASNIVPEIYADLICGDVPVPEINESVQDFVAWLFAEPNPIGVNTALSMLGRVQPVFRLPYVPYSKDLRERGAELMRAFGDDKISGGLADLRIMDDSDFVLMRHPQH